MARAEEIIRQILSPAGISLNGDDPWDIAVRDARFFRRVLNDGSLGFGEAYMDGWWECEQLDEFFTKILPTNAEEKLRKNVQLLVQALGSVIMKPWARMRAFQVGRRHYDLGNDLFRKMLDRRMIYSCAVWDGARDLDEAQEAKLDLICRKLALRPGDRLLDIGCGWGGLAQYAAERYGVEVVGITVSKEQAEVAQERCSGLPVEIRLQDYRDVEERFDRIVSVGMFEHVGCRHHRTYMERASRCLSDDGLFLLHTIGCDVSQPCLDPWFAKYIFPNSSIPSVRQISSAAEGLFVTESVQNIGMHYDATLMSWFGNFDRNWDELRPRYDERFYRMWKYYLLSSAGAFRSRNLHVWQFVYSKRETAGGVASACSPGPETGSFIVQPPSFSAIRR